MAVAKDYKKFAHSCAPSLPEAAKHHKFACVRRTALPPVRLRLQHHQKFAHVRRMALPALSKQQGFLPIIISFSPLAKASGNSIKGAAATRNRKRFNPRPSIASIFRWRRGIEKTPYPLLRICEIKNILHYPNVKQPFAIAPAVLLVGRCTFN